MPIQLKVLWKFTFVYLRTFANYSQWVKKCHLCMWNEIRFFFMLQNNYRNKTRLFFFEFQTRVQDPLPTKWALPICESKKPEINSTPAVSTLPTPSKKKKMCQKSQREVYWPPGETASRARDCPRLNPPLHQQLRRVPKPHQDLVRLNIFYPAMFCLLAVLI